MKKLILTFALSFLWISLSVASDPAFEKAMKKQIIAMDQIANAEQSKEVANGFLRIAEAKSEEWLPLYYAGLIHIEAAFRFEVNKDQYLDQALKYIEQAEKLAPANSEVTALKGYAIMGKISLDPASRGQNLSPQAMQLFGKAINLDRENPRALYLMAQMEYGMAQFFGSGTDKACGMVRLSLELFEKEESIITEDYILPKWGKRSAQQMMNNCN